MIPLFKVNMSDSVGGSLLRTLHSGQIGQGPLVDEFEKLFGHFIGNRRVLAVNAGTSALQLALRLAKVGPGDVVITTAMTCTATNLPILAAGAIPVFADIDSKTGNIDVLSVSRLLHKYGRKVKAIMCVDWGGLPAPLANLMELGHEYKIKVIEDAAHALGAIYDGKKVGSIADFTCFSLQAIKHITTGDGGMLACKSPMAYRRGKKLRWFGIDREAEVQGDSRIDVDIPEWGYKFHMNDLAASIGISQMRVLPTILEVHRANAAYYDKNICKCIGRPPRGRGSAYWLYTLLIPQGLRNQFKEFMAKAGIQVSQVHRRNDEYTVFNGYAVDGEMPGTKAFAEAMVCIPVHTGLTNSQREHIVASVNKFATKAGL